MKNKGKLSSEKVFLKYGKIKLKLKLSFANSVC